jgi:predicted transcriptional regulator
MALVDIEALIKAVPVGKDNAESSIQIWKRLDLWAPITIRSKLNGLVAEGRIERVSRPSHKGGDAYFYHRK